MTDGDRPERAVRPTIVVHHTPPERCSGGVAVVIDVLRWSTTCVAALANGATGIEAFETPEAASARARSLRAAAVDALTAGERNAHRIAGFDLGNSPLECTRARVAGRVLCATTTNGTRALVAARDARRVFVAGFVNLSATAAYIRTLLAKGAAADPAAGALAAGASAAGDVHHVDLVCAGSEGRPSPEDSACAEALAAALEGRASAVDLEALGAEAPHANTLRAAGYAEDVAFALRRDTLPLVAALRAGRVVALAAVDASS